MTASSSWRRHKYTIHTLHAYIQTIYTEGDGGILNLPRAESIGHCPLFSELIREHPRRPSWGVLLAWTIIPCDIEAKPVM